MTTNSQTASANAQQRERLAALAIQLKTHQFVVELGLSGLLVRHPQQHDLADTISCRHRPEDGNRLWFFTSWNDPIADASLPVDAVVRIKGYLVVKP